jgi:glutathione synthase/RimK-type ligase-like ATP-grasp enzyme
MSKVTNFDVLVVYSAFTATSASSPKPGNNTPFSLFKKKNDLDHSYAYFMTACRQMKLKAAFTTSADIIGPGTCRSYWTYGGDGWNKVIRPARSRVIFDKFAPYNPRQTARRELMFSSPRVRPFNSRRLYQLFFDKLSTYESLADISIPTVLVSKTSIKDLKELLELHRHQADFGGGYVLKDRFGSAGNHVYKIARRGNTKIGQILKSNPKVRFILQPLVKFDHEIRLIFMGNKIVQTYIRTAPVGGFCCNDHQGGSSEYIKKSQVPDRVLNLAHSLSQKLSVKNSLYALDFVISKNGNPYLLEGNTGPGLNWDPANKVDEIKSHQLIQIIVAELAKRV